MSDWSPSNGSGQGARLRQSVEAGFAEPLVKPVDIDELVALMQRFGGGSDSR